MAARKALPALLLVNLSRIYVESVLIYAAPAWLGSASESQLKRLEAKQALAIRSALDAPWEVEDADVLAAGLLLCPHLVPIREHLTTCRDNYLARKWSHDEHFRRLVSHLQDQTNLVSNRDLLRHSPFFYFRPDNPLTPILPLPQTTFLTGAESNV